MPGDDRALPVDEDRIREAELADRGGDLRDLRVAVRARVGGVGDQLLDRPALDRVRENRGVGHDVLFAGGGCPAMAYLCPAQSVGLRPSRDVPRWLYGADGRARTCDLPLTRRAHYRLCYVGNARRMSAGRVWKRVSELNRRPSAYEADALPPALTRNETVWPINGVSRRSSPAYPVSARAMGYLASGRRSKGRNARRRPDMKKPRRISPGAVHEHGEDYVLGFTMSIDHRHHFDVPRRKTLASWFESSETIVFAAACACFEVKPRRDPATPAGSSKMTTFSHTE